MRVVVTGAGGSAAANFADALLRDLDVELIGVDIRPYHLELFPAAHRYLVPSVDDPAYLDTLARVVDKHQVDLVHPQPDPEVRLLAHNRDAVGATVFLPPGDVIDLCQDKAACTAQLAAAGVAAPRTAHVSVDGIETAIGTVRGDDDRVWLRATRGAGSRAALPVRNATQAVGWLDYWAHHAGLTADDFMVSEFLPGAEFAWQSLWWRGRLVTSQARERVEYLFGRLMPSGQSSSPSVARTVNRADINTVGTAAVRAVMAEPHGVFCVDLKAGRDGAPRVTEINAGRFFTTSNFFAHAGLNMPAMYVRLALGAEPPSDVPAYDPLPEGLYWVRLADMGYRLVEDGGWSSQQA